MSPSLGWKSRMRSACSSTVGERIVALSALKHIVTASANYCIVTCFAVSGIVALSADDLIVATPSTDPS